MREYALIILNVSDAVPNIRSLYKLLKSYRDREYLEHCQIFKMERFVKRIMPGCKCTTRIFQGREWGKIVEMGDFNKHFIKNTRKRSPAGKHFCAFSPRYS